MKIDTEFEKRWKKELTFLFFKEGEELQFCLVAQGYEALLVRRLMVLLGSVFVALEIIKNIKEELK